MTVTLNGNGEPPAQLTLRRGRPRYRVGYIAEVIQYIAAKQRRHGHRPVHIALSIACLELRISKRTWLRIVRTLVAAHWLRREVRTGGKDNRGALYWLLDPPTGQHRLEYTPPPPPAPVTITDGKRSRGVDVDAPIRNLIAETIISNTDPTFLHRPLNVPETGSERIPGTFPSGAIGVASFRIAERSLEKRTRPTDGTSAAGAPKEPPAAATDQAVPAEPSAAISPPSPSLTSGNGSAGTGVAIRYPDGSTEMIPRSGPPPDVAALVAEILRRPGPKAQAYIRRMEALAMTEIANQGGTV